MSRRVSSNTGGMNAGAAGAVVVRGARDDVESIALASGGPNSMPLTGTLKNGDTWMLEVVKTSKKHAEQVISAFSGNGGPTAARKEEAKR